MQKNILYGEVGGSLVFIQRERPEELTTIHPGNFLFSTGPNTQGGGTRATTGHYDVPMSRWTAT